MRSTYRTCIALKEKPNKTPSYLSFEITGPEVCAIWYTETEVNLYKKHKCHVSCRGNSKEWKTNISMYTY